MRRTDRDNAQATSHAAVRVRPQLLDRLVNHPWLIGDPTTPGRRLGKRVRWLAVIAIVVANAPYTSRTCDSDACCCRR